MADRPKKAPAPRPSAGGSLYERYKDALRRGHVASLRGRYEAAIGAYSEAAAIAPDRALPHAAIGGILVKMGRPEEALETYGRALSIAPRDEQALRGRAELLAAAGRRVEAADLLDRLAEVLDGSGRLPDATDAARRALELAESRERRRQVEAYAERLRASAGDEAAARALAQVLRVLEPPVAPASVVPDAGLAPEPAMAAVPEPVIESEPTPLEPGEATAVIDEAADAAADVDAVTEPAAAEVEREAGVESVQREPADVAEAAAAEAVEPEPEAEPQVPAGEAVLEAATEPAAEEPPQPEAEPEPQVAAIDAFALGRAAEDALAAGDAETARDGLLAAAAAHRLAGRSFAAIDACYLALAVAPADVDLHVLLTELYLERGWRGPAVDKLLLLGRLAELAEDTGTRERLCAIATDQLPDESRLAELCA